MNNFSVTLLVLLFPIAFSCFGQEPSIAIVPKTYVCYRVTAPIKIDGLPDESDWQKASWSEPFVDIEGSLKPEPALKTKMKLLWDDKYLYIAAELEEPNVWATLTERESVIFNDNDFEFFVDPDGDTHHYLEYEMNALNTQWDLMLLKPYRDDLIHNVAIDNWNFNGLKSSVHIDGTLNNPNDTDKGWSIEIAVPMDAMIEVSATGKLPVNGEQYRMDFSRVEWDMDVIDGKYRKRTQVIEGKRKPIPEHNWVWSPQGVIAMHQPETWGYVQFSDKKVGKGTDEYVRDADEDLKWALRLIYYRENAWMEKHHSFTSDLKQLNLYEYKLKDRTFMPLINVSSKSFEANSKSANTGKVWHIIQDGRIWFE